MSWIMEYRPAILMSVGKVRHMGCPQESKQDSQQGRVFLFRRKEVAGRRGCLLAEKDIAKGIDSGIAMQRASDLFVIERCGQPVRCGLLPCQ